MTYFEQLHPWCITRTLPNSRRLIVARFRRRGDAEAHLQILRRLISNVVYVIIFDAMVEQKDPTQERK